MQLGREVADLRDALGPLPRRGLGGTLEAADGVGEVDGHRVKVPQKGCPTEGGCLDFGFLAAPGRCGYCPLV